MLDVSKRKGPQQSENVFPKKKFPLPLKTRTLNSFCVPSKQKKNVWIQFNIQMAPPPPMLAVKSLHVQHNPSISPDRMKIRNIWCNLKKDNILCVYHILRVYDQ